MFEIGKTTLNNVKGNNRIETHGINIRLRITDKKFTLKKLFIVIGMVTKKAIREVTKVLNLYLFIKLLYSTKNKEVKYEY